jgi:hypothetical protein
MAATSYPLTDEITDAVCDWLVSGKPLAEFCEIPGNPSLGTLNVWRATNDLFAKRFAQARDIGFDSIAERLRTTVRGGATSTGDWKRDRLVAETELKLLAAWAPKRYGARIENEHNLGNMDPGELGARVAALLDKAIQSLAGVPTAPIEPVLPAKPTAVVPEDASFLTPRQREVLTETEPYPVAKKNKPSKAKLARKALAEQNSPPPEADEERW